MFGYIKPLTSELKVKEYEFYRAVYCGLCLSLGKCTGCASRLTLSYDFVFLALVRMSLTKEVGIIKQRRCAAHPIKKRAMLTSCKELDISARLSAALTYHKLEDDISDGKGFKRLGARALVPAARSMKKRAALDYSAEAHFADRISELAKLEKSQCDSLDKAAEPFGELMAQVFSYGYSENSSEARLAAEIGRHIGRFVYIIDAVDDLTDDLKSGSYNPLALMYTDPIGELETDRLRLALTMELSELSKAVELIDFSGIYEYGSIIKNIIYLGLPEIIDKTIKKYSDNSED